MYVFIYLRTYIKITVKGKESMNVRGNEGKARRGLEGREVGGVGEKITQYIIILAPQGNEGDDAIVF